VSDRVSVEIFPGEVFANTGDFDSGIRQLIPYYDEMLAAIARCLPVQASHILELGCGTGELSLQILQNRPTASVIALDYSPRMIEYARKKVEAAGYGDRWQGIAMDFGDWATGQQLDEKVESFDACASSLAIHHLSNAMKLILFKKIAESLKAGACFWNADPVVLETPQLSEVYQKAREDWAIAQGTTLAEVRAKLGASNNYGYSSQDQLATLEEHLQMLKTAGFDSVEVPWKYFGLAVFGGFKGSKSSL
jgi:tRNA (cmo5U34)-methyltransferase